MRKHLFILLTLLPGHLSPHAAAQPPKLVVVVVLDQVPYDYISRFRPYFAKGGFNYFLDHGANFTDAQYQYAYTKTGCGHAAIFTGTNGNVNGIVGNAWYDRTKKKRVGCVDDETEHLVGAPGTGCSPRALLVNTIGDLLRKRTDNRSKVVGISNKDRSAILMAGKSGTAYWVDDSLIVSSTYYLRSLPSWVVNFNRSGIFQKYFGRVWTELSPEIAGTICDKDDVPYEDNPAGMGRAFPHRITGTDTTSLSPSYYDALNHSPFAIQILLDFARLEVEKDSLALRGTTDMLCLSISTTDIIGHSYGPNSHEVFDNMLRTDAMLAEFLSFLDRKVGLQNCLLVVTADHGIAPIPEYKRKVSPEVNAVRIGTTEITSRANRILNNRFGKASTPWIAATIDANIYLSDEAVKEEGLRTEVVRKALKDSLMNDFPIDKAYTADDLLGNSGEGCFCERLKLSFYPSRSGDVMILVQPFCIIDAATTGTNHGMPYTYDAHVPLMISGPNVRQGEYGGRASPTDIAPTLAALLRLEPPSGFEGNVLSEAMMMKK